MDERMEMLYRNPNDSEQEICLLMLREQCDALEERLRGEILTTIADYKREIIELYMEVRDELEFQTVKEALRIGRKSDRRLLDDGLGNSSG